MKECKMNVVEFTNLEFHMIVTALTHEANKCEYEYGCGYNNPYRKLVDALLNLRTARCKGGTKND